MANLFLLLVSAAMGTTDGIVPEHMLIDAQAAIAEIDAGADDRQLIRLPDLQFELAIKPMCGAAGRVESISVSVADTRQSYDLDDVNEQSVVDVALSIPSNQLSPVRIGDFCRTTVANSAEDMELTIRGALTAHLSLRCLNDEEQSMTYVSQALDVILRCNKIDDSPMESPEDQESSAEPEPKL